MRYHVEDYGTIGSPSDRFVHRPSNLRTFDYLKPCRLLQSSPSAYLPHFPYKQIFHAHILPNTSGLCLNCKKTLQRILL